MQQFTVPQFIDVEDKIIGPITTRQFLIILAGFMLIAVGYKFFDFSLFVTFGIFMLVLMAIFAFVKINGMPFHFFILNFLQTISRPDLRVWNNTVGKVETLFEVESVKTEPEPVPEADGLYTMSRLAELSLIVDTQGAYRGEERDGAAEIRINRPAADRSRMEADTAGADGREKK